MPRVALAQGDPKRLNAGATVAISESIRETAMGTFHVDPNAVHAMQARRAVTRSRPPETTASPRPSGATRMSPCDPILLARAAAERRGRRSPSDQPDWKRMPQL
jgi:hypothetical protein